MAQDPDYKVEGMGRTGMFKMSANAWGHYERLHAAVGSSANTASRSRVVLGAQTNQGRVSKRGHAKRGMN